MSDFKAVARTTGVPTKAYAAIRYYSGFIFLGMADEPQGIQNFDWRKQLRNIAPT